MKTLYLDCFSGISGDMTLGALAALGADTAYLEEELKKLNIEGEYSLSFEKTNSYGIGGVHAIVDVLHHHEHGHHHKHEHHEHEHHHHHTSYKEIKKLIEESGISEKAKEKALFMFEKIAVAEAEVHGKSVEDVCFHEVGAVDSIIDICGVAIMLDNLGVEKIMHSTVNVGGGTVKCAHGVMPVPAPATAKLLAGRRIKGEDGIGELTTPTGAAILLLGEEGAIPSGDIAKEGFGFGTKDLGRANCLRAMIIEEGEKKETDEVYELSANIDDMTGEELAFAAKRLLDAGALDAWITPIVMKKGRAANMLCALSSISDKDKIVDVFFKNTTTLGVRYVKKQRSILKRRFIKTTTPYGEITVKLTENGAHPEYDDCARAAQAYGINLREAAESAKACCRED